MKKILSTLLAVAIFAGILVYRTTLRERELVILSTNDMHATIDNFPQLVTAVNLSRDTVATLLVDAGDRWTGNAFIDLAEGRLPIIELMNHAGYDVAALGNHEFDKGAAMLQGAIDHADFDILCANMKSCRDDMATPKGATVLRTKNGIKVAVAGVVTNYDSGHPDGSHEVFAGLEFCDPMAAAEEALQHYSTADLRVVLSHMGDDKDLEYAAATKSCDVVIGGHTHMEVDSTVNGVVVGQTGRKLKYLGATTVRMRGNKVVSIDYRNIPLTDYEKDSATMALIDKIESDPVLGAKVGEFDSPVTHIGFANLMARAVADATGADIGLYHYGGVRLTEHPAGDVKLATIYNLEPFASTVHTAVMTPAELRKMIIAKYNDTKNPKESHRLDLFCTTPYDIVVDGSGEAIDVYLPKLQKGKKYVVAMADYIGKKYPYIAERERTEHPILVTSQLLKILREEKKVKINNISTQKIVKR